MTVLLPASDGVAGFAARRLPQVEVVRYGQAERHDYAEPPGRSAQVIETPPSTTMVWPVT